MPKRRRKMTSMPLRSRQFMAAKMATAMELAKQKGFHDFTEGGAGARARERFAKKIHAGERKRRSKK